MAKGLIGDRTIEYDARARDARRDGPCQCACSLLSRVAFGKSSDQDVNLVPVIVGDDPIPAPRSSGCRGFAERGSSDVITYLPAPVESAVYCVSARDSETTKGSKRSHAYRGVTGGRTNNYSLYSCYFETRDSIKRVSFYVRVKPITRKQPPVSGRSARARAPQGAARVIRAARFTSFRIVRLRAFRGS